MKKQLLKLLVCCALSTCALNAASMDLVSNGKSDYRIVVPAKMKNENLERFAKLSAELLQSCVKESTGVDLSIMAEDERGMEGPAIFVGDTEFAKKAGVRLKDLEGWNYREKAVGRNIILAGNDHPDVPGEKSRRYDKYVLGTLKAVTSFLKRELDVKFLLPGPNGIEVPKRDAIVVDDQLDVIGEPFLKINTGRLSEPVYDIANNYFPVNSFKLYGGHSYNEAVPAKEYVAKNPEYFALLGGKRNSTGNHLCISNPDVQELIYQEMLKQLDKGYDYVELGQSDGYKPCGCESCAKLFGVSEPGEKLWILHKKMAERLARERPGKNVVVIAYGPTVKPPETFHEFPDNMMIELTDYSRETLEKWKRREVPAGFISYVYNWGPFWQPGLTPKTTPRSVGVQARRFKDHNLRGIYRCGWGELCGLEGPSYYVYGRSFDEDAPSYDELANEFFKAAYGKAYMPMKSFFETMHKRLELYANFLATRCPAQRFLPMTPKPVIAYNFSPEILESMEKNLTQAEKAAVNHKVTKRIALVRKEFDYVRNLASIIHCYNAYKIALNQQSFDNLAKLVQERNKMVDSYYDSEGGMRRLDGWKHVKFLGAFGKDIIKVNGKLSAPINSPLTWDITNLRKKGVLPGTGKKKLIIRETTRHVPMGGDLESGVWADAPFQEIGGIQMGKTRQFSKFKALYDDDCLYLGFEASLPPGSSPVRPVGHDGPAWQQESFEVFLSPDSSPDRILHFIFNPAENSTFDAENSLLIDPLSPLFGKDDKTWDAEWQCENNIDWEKGRWSAVVKIPFHSLGVSSTPTGETWRVNVARNHFHTEKNDHHPKQELYLWSPNLETMSFQNRDCLGELVFAKQADN